MIWKLSLLILFSSLIVLALAESYIEVDENGDEYEVKKFYIQGRQANSSPQCVVTRRRRGTETSRQYNVEPVYEENESMAEQVPHDAENPLEDMEDNDEEDESQDVIRIEESDDMNMDMKSNKTVAVVPEVDIKDTTETKPTDAKKEMVKPSQNEKPKKGEKKEEMEKEDKDEKKDSDDKKDKETIVVEHKVPKKNKLQKVTLIRPQANEETEVPQQSFQVAPPALLSHTANNEFIVINAQQPQASPVSQLSSLLGAIPANEDYEGNSDIYPFSWVYSNEPISTSAIWSTGENLDNAFNKIPNSQKLDKFPDDLSSSDIIDPDYLTYPQSDELRPSRPVRNRPPNKNSRPNKRRKVVVRRPVQNVRRKVRPMRNGRPGNPVRRPQSAIQRPNKRQKPVVNMTINRPSNVVQANRKKQNKTKKRKSNKRGQNNASFNKNKRKTKRKGTQPGFVTSTYSRSVTSTGNDSNIDCIIINKDKEEPPKTTSTTTTPRPFWNVFGRRASNLQGRDFGNRKRANLRFTA